MSFSNPKQIIDFLQKDIDVFDADYQRGWGNRDAIQKIQEYLRKNPTAQAKDIKTIYPNASDEDINDAFDEIEVVNTLAGVPAPRKQYYRGIEYNSNENKEGD